MAEFVLVMNIIVRFAVVGASTDPDDEVANVGIGRSGFKSRVGGGKKMPLIVGSSLW